MFLTNIALYGSNRPIINTFVEGRTYEGPLVEGPDVEGPNRQLPDREGPDVEGPPTGRFDVTCAYDYTQATGTFFEDEELKARDTFQFHINTARTINPRPGPDLVRTLEGVSGVGECPVLDTRYYYEDGSKIDTDDLVDRSVHRVIYNVARNLSASTAVSEEGPNVEGPFIEGAIVEGPNIEGPFLEGPDITDPDVGTTAPRENWY